VASERNFKKLENNLHGSFAPNYNYSSWSDVLLTFSKQPATNTIPRVNSSSLPDTDEVMPVQNILIWFNDAVSESNYIYSVPRTWAFLESLLEEKSGNGGFWFRSHNVLGRNTNPNLIPLFTGYREDDWMRTKRTREFRDKKFLFRRFENAGSVTVYYEDAQDPNEPPWIAWSPLAGKHNKKPGHYFPYVFMKRRFEDKKEMNPICISDISSNMVGIFFLLHFYIHCVNKWNFLG
jgi:hypothetical protein